MLSILIIVHFIQHLSILLQQLGGKCHPPSQLAFISFQKFHDHFGCDRILHQDSITTSTRSVEMQLTGTDPIAIANDLLVIPMSGHAKGHTVLLYGQKFLFSGDHLA